MRLTSIKAKPSISMMSMLKRSAEDGTKKFYLPSISFDITKSS